MIPQRYRLCLLFVGIEGFLKVLLAPLADVFLTKTWKTRINRKKDLAAGKTALAEVPSLWQDCNS